MKVHLLVIIFLLGIGNTPIVCLANAQPAKPITAQKGILDLRNTDLSSRPLTLHGAWQFYWHQLIKPGDTLSSTPDYSDFPSLWKNKQVHGHQLSSDGYASYVL